MSSNEANEFYVAGNDAFIEEDFDKAKELYTKAIQSNPSNALYFDRRAAVYIKCKQYSEAVKDANSALALDASLHSALLNKGTALFYKDEFAEAKEALAKAEALGNKKCSLLIRKCDAELRRTSTPQDEQKKSSSLPTTAHAAPAAAASTVPLNTKVTYSHFQTVHDLTLTVYAKNVKKDNAVVSLSNPSELLVELTLPDSTVYHNVFHLYAPVQSEIKFTITAYKLEVVLQKIDKFEWPSLLGSDKLADPTSQPQIVQRENVIRDIPNITAYPTSSKHKINFTEVEQAAVQLEAEEKPTGDKGLQKLFQDIYRDADEDSRRAMIKSFQTSGGTVLNTNWKEVKDKNYEDEISAPAGQEVRRWKDLGR